ncbi:hypothetical protein L6164_014685 [Bauhinia variegata]|uniref:Uncharacterized protein n=1 Tax=Bauhinia variegata TaxID=167791 RepID=A0ACB9NJK9_BAUVA|nr:hypothetical protein L6164_014685 [Bauhinia variegata]
MHRNTGYVPWITTFHENREKGSKHECLLFLLSKRPLVQVVLCHDLSLKQQIATGRRNPKRQPEEKCC